MRETVAACPAELDDRPLTCFEAQPMMEILPSGIPLRALLTLLTWSLLSIVSIESTAGVRPVFWFPAEEQSPDTSRKDNFPREAEGDIETLFRHGPFLLTVKKVPEGGRFKVEVRKDGRTLYGDESHYTAPPVDIVEDLPHKGCSTLVAYCFSGGAHCCTRAILCTICGPEESMTVFDLSNLTELIISPRGSGEPPEVSLLDYQFAYYHARDASLWFPFSQSPAMERLLVYGNGGWRVDRPGENKGFYERIMARNGCMEKVRIPAPRAEGEEALEMAAQAIECAYYAMMAGEDTDVPGKILKDRLPRAWQSEFVSLLQDIKRAVADFSAIRKSYKSQGR